MKQELEKLIINLNTDKLYCVTVYDRDLRTNVHRNLMHQEIIDTFGSAEELMEDLNQKGHINLTFHPKRKNGSSFKVVENSFDVQFGAEKQTTKKMNTQPTAVKTKKKKKAKAKNADLNLFGLNAMDILDLKIRAKEADKLEKDFNETREKYVAVKLKCKELEEEKLQKKYSAEKNEQLYGTIKDGLKSLPMVMKGLGYPVPGAEGLNASTTNDDDGLTQVQKEWLDIVRGTEDNMLQILKTIHVQLNTPMENNVFATDLQKILVKHKLIVV